MKKSPPIECSTCEKRETSVFCDLSEKECREIDSSKTINIYKTHQIIFYEGNQPYGLYCINKGKVKIYKASTEGTQRIVRLAGPGDIIGYRCLLSNQPYAGTAETLEETTVCFIDKTTFFHLLEKHSATSLRITTLLAEDLGRAEKQMLDVAHKNIRERFAELLLILKNKYGRENSRGTELKIKLTRREMAELIGTTQESLIRLLSEFKKDGLLEADGHVITLLDFNKLLEIANLTD